MNFKNYKFRCSGLANLLVNPRSKKETLSETTKSYLRETWIKEAFGREKYITNKYMEKGTIVESDSLDLLKDATGGTYFKNKTHYDNDYISGTPDVVSKDEVIDIKSSWDIFTFAAVDEVKALKTYEAQLQGYMWLTGRKTSRLIYCLVNTPDQIMQHEIYVLKLRHVIEDTENDDIDVKLRMKQYTINADEGFQYKLIDKIVAARDYMNQITL